MELLDPLEQRSHRVSGSITSHSIPNSDGEQILLPTYSAVPGRPPRRTQQQLDKMGTLLRLDPVYTGTGAHGSQNMDFQINDAAV